MTAKYDFSKKVAIITGGGRGIGRSIALGLADCGAKVVLAARSEDQLNSVVEEVKTKGSEALPVVTDLMVGGQIDNLVQTAKDRYGRVDILINNAARSYLRPLMELREDGWDKIFGINCKAVFLLSREVAQIMSEHQGGRIINVSTVGAVRGGAGMAAYHASKAAISMLTKCMAVEWAPLNINVNAVGPGLTKTAFSQPLWENPDVEKMVSTSGPTQSGAIFTVLPSSSDSLSAAGPIRISSTTLPLGRPR
jgi:2-deoxy-D-gluconate 3-dehydrogenase